MVLPHRSTIWKRQSKQQQAWYFLSWYNYQAQDCRFFSNLLRAKKWPPDMTHSKSSEFILSIHPYPVFLASLSPSQPRRWHQQRTNRINSCCQFKCVPVRTFNNCLLLYFKSLTPLIYHNPYLAFHCSTLGSRASPAGCHLVSQEIRTLLVVFVAVMWNTSRPAQNHA